MMSTSSSARAIAFNHLQRTTIILQFYADDVRMKNVINTLSLLKVAIIICALYARVTISSAKYVYTYMDNHERTHDDNIAACHTIL